MSGLRIQYEMVKTMSMTESLMFVAGKIFGDGKDKGAGPQGGIQTVEQAQAFTAMVNGLG